MKPVCLNLNECKGLGDLLCATPTIKVIAESYGQKITILSSLPELFKNNPYVEKSYKFNSMNYDYFVDNYIIHNSFYNVGKKNERGIEYKHNKIDIRQFHAINLGFMLLKDEMECFYQPTEPCKLHIPTEKYVLVHAAQNWASRTWSAENWAELCRKLIELSYVVIVIGKDSSEVGFFNVQKPVFNINVDKCIDYTNKTSISDCWYLIDKCHAFVTMDSGLLHLAGTTDANIIQLGSSINPEFRKPYRKGSQDYKLKYVSGGCDAMCASNMKWGVKEWGTIQGVPPLIGCLEGKQSFECHPSVDMVIKAIQDFDNQ